MKTPARFETALKGWKQSSRTKSLKRMKTVLLRTLNENEISANTGSFARLRQSKRAGKKLKNGIYKKSRPFESA